MTVEDTPLVVAPGVTVHGQRYDQQAADAAAVWTSFTATVDSDQAGTIAVETSTDGVVFTTSASRPSHADATTAVTATPASRYARASWTNGSGRPTARLQLSSSSNAGDAAGPSEASEATAASVTAAIATAAATAAADVAAAGWQGAWAIGTTYAKSATVSGSDSHVYESMVAGNVGHDPTTDAGAHWQKLAA